MTGKCFQLAAECQICLRMFAYVNICLCDFSVFLALCFFRHSYRAQFSMPAGNGNQWSVIVVNHHGPRPSFDIYNSAPGGQKWAEELDRLALNLEVLRPGESHTQKACEERARRWRHNYKPCYKVEPFSNDTGVYAVYTIEKLIKAGGGEPKLLKTEFQQGRWRERIRLVHMGLLHAQREMMEAGFMAEENEASPAVSEGAAAQQPSQSGK